MAQNNNHEGGKMAMGIGIAALAAAAAGAYFLYGTDAGKKKRKEVKGWMLKAKGEILEKMEGLKDVSQETYDQVVDTVAQRYEGVKNVDPIELAALVRDVKAHWNNIRKALEGGSKKKTSKGGAKRKATKSQKSA